MGGFQKCSIFHRIFSRIINITVIRIIESLVIVAGFGSLPFLF